MAGKKYGFDTSALAKYAEQLEDAGGHAAIKRAAEAGMKQAKVEINKRVIEAMQPGNLPAGGKYSTGATMAAMSKDMSVSWEGNKAELPIGFDLNNGGMASVFLITGTPRMQPAYGLWHALYGKEAHRAANKAQEEAMLKVLERLGG